MNSKTSQNVTPLTLEQMVSYMEPQFQKIREEFQQIHTQLREHNGHFDFLFKKFEDLEQEYLFANEQMKRLDQNTSIRAT